MNNILKLSVKFNNMARVSSGGPRNLPNKATIKTKHVETLIKELDSVINYWEKNTEFISNTLINVHYTKIVPKSSRITYLFKEKNKEPNESIVGAKFEIYERKKKHVMTHCLEFETLKNTREELSECLNILQINNIQEVDNVIFNKIKSSYSHNKCVTISYTKFLNLLIDCFYVRALDVSDSLPEMLDDRIITLYDTDINLEVLFDKLGLEYDSKNFIDNHTMYVTVGQYEILRNKVPYLVAMSVGDISNIPNQDYNVNLFEDEYIPEPQNEPVIGVIDTLFDENVYFSNWVDYREMVDKNVTVDYFKSYNHGTAVSSIIVDGPTLNPALDDGCGRFRVRHFGIVAGDRFSGTTVYKKIKEIVKNNLDIKVWNLSLGSNREIDENYISPIAALLDKLQYEHDIVFVIAGTNKLNEKTEKIGSPADSINSLVVNSVNFKKEPASYSRRGPVLSFFTKPDVCYFGGDGFDEIKVYTGNGKLYKSGTSFAAPWIARKLAYLIQVLRMPREIAKALIIDSAAGWHKNEFSSNLIGYGVVPQKISDIVQSKDDEIRFFMSGESTNYNTYFYRLPVPKSSGRYPYIAKATLCYFPKCNRLQGVDYTCTEFDFHFGRINDKGTIVSINDNKQNEDHIGFNTEDEARECFRKWDNIKFIGEFDNSRKRAKKVFDDKNWGLKILTTERLNEKCGENLKFGVVITLKELDGKNRIDQFIQQCEINNIFVTPITIENKVDVYNKAQSEIDFN